MSLHQKVWLKFFFTQLLLYSSTLPVATRSLHPIYTLFRAPEEGMVGMECQVEMAGMEDKEKKETLVCWDHLVHEVCMLTWMYQQTANEYSAWQNLQQYQHVMRCAVHSFHCIVFIYTALDYSISLKLRKTSCVVSNHCVENHHLLTSPHTHTHTRAPRSHYWWCGIHQVG